MKKKLILLFKVGLITIVSMIGSGLIFLFVGQGLIFNYTNDVRIVILIVSAINVLLICLGGIIMNIFRRIFKKEAHNAKRS